MGIAKLSKPLPKSPSNKASNKEPTIENNIILTLRALFTKYKIVSSTKRVIIKNKKLPSQDFSPVMLYFFLPNLYPNSPAIPSDSVRIKTDP